MVMGDLDSKFSTAPYSSYQRQPKVFQISSALMQRNTGLV